MELQVEPFIEVPSVQLAFRALARSRSTHSMYMVFHALESMVGTQVDPTNALLAQALGLKERTISLILYMLGRTGFVLVQSDSGGRNRRIELLPWAEDWTLVMLRGLWHGSLTIDLQHQSVYVTETREPLELPLGRCSLPHGSVGCDVSEAEDLAVSPCDIEGCVVSNDDRQVLPSYDAVVVSSINITKDLKYYAQEHRSIATIGMQGGPEPKASAAAAPKGGRPALPVTDEMRRVYAGWQDAVGARRFTLKPGITASRIRARLNDGFTVDELVLVAEWAKQDPWMSGNHPQNQTPYLSTETLYRSGERTHSYILKATKWLSQGRPTNNGVHDRRALDMNPFTPSIGSDVF